MATTYGILGQVSDASTEQDLYTVATGKNVKVRITVTNRAGSAATFRLAIAPDGGATGNEDYVAYDKTIAANESITSTTFTINDSDVIRAESSTANVTFVVFGIEQDTA